MPAANPRISEFERVKSACRSCNRIFFAGAAGAVVMGDYFLDDVAQLLNGLADDLLDDVQNESAGLAGALQPLDRVQPVKFGLVSQTRQRRARVALGNGFRVRTAAHVQGPTNPFLSVLTT